MANRCKDVRAFTHITTLLYTCTSISMQTLKHTVCSVVIGNNVRLILAKSSPKRQVRAQFFACPESLSEASTNDSKRKLLKGFSFLNPRARSVCYFHQWNLLAEWTPGTVCGIPLCNPRKCSSTQIPQVWNSLKTIPRCKHLSVCLLHFRLRMWWTLSLIAKQALSTKVHGQTKCLKVHIVENKMFESAHCRRCRTYV